MKVAWLADQHVPPGGAELTQAEFRAAAPDGVQVVAVPPDELERVRDCDTACVFNSVTYPGETIRALTGKDVVRYYNDLVPHGNEDLKLWLAEHARCVFTSPLHFRRFESWVSGDRVHVLIPPSVDQEPFRKAAEGAQERAGAVSVAAWMNPAKAAHRAAEWASGNGGIDFYGHGPYAPDGAPSVAYDDMPALLASYETFVFLPEALEPFGRLVVEAHAAGCRVVTNRNVGAKYWIEEEPEKLESAGTDFWSLVTA